MRNTGFYIFFSIVIVLYILINFSICNRGLQALQYYPRIKPWYLLIFITLSSAYIAGRFAERLIPSAFSNTLTFAGSFWLAAMIYFSLAIIFLDLIRLFNSLFHFFPAALIINYPRVKFITGITILVSVIVILIAGHINAVKPKITKLDIHIAKKAGTISKLKIAAVSDIHLGNIIGRSRLEKIVFGINNLNPDLVLIAGDVFDEDISIISNDSIGEVFKSIRSEYGVFFIPGNHEYYGDIEKAVKYLSSQNIVVLRDSVVCINNSFYLAGRDDKEFKRFSGRSRKTIDSLLQGLDKTLPVILMDHQPFKLNESVLNGVDLQISGHTHHGQLFPANIITGWIYEISHGYKKSGDTHFYVSSGAGTWGPPVRIGSTPEIVNITIDFE